MRLKKLWIPFSLLFLYDLVTNYGFYISMRKTVSHDVAFWYSNNYFFTSSLFHGEIPMWNPFSYGGQAFHIDAYAQYCFKLPYLFLSYLCKLVPVDFFHNPLRIWHLYHGLLIFIFVAGSYLVYKHLTRNSLASLFGSFIMLHILWSISAYQNAYVNISYLLPLFLYYFLKFLDRINESEGPFYFFCTCICMTLPTDSFGGLYFLLPAIALITAALITFRPSVRNIKIFLRNNIVLVSATILLMGMNVLPVALLRFSIDPDSDLIVTREIFYNMPVNQVVKFKEWIPAVYSLSELKNNLCGILNRNLWGDRMFSLSPLFLIGTVLGLIIIVKKNFEKRNNNNCKCVVKFLMLISFASFVFIALAAGEPHAVYSMKKIFPITKWLVEMEFFIIFPIFFLSIVFVYGMSEWFKAIVSSFSAYKRLLLVLPLIGLFSYFLFFSFKTRNLTMSTRNPDSNLATFPMEYEFQWWRIPTLPTEQWNNELGLQSPNILYGINTFSFGHHALNVNRDFFELMTTISANQAKVILGISKPILRFYDQYLVEMDSKKTLELIANTNSECLEKTLILSSEPNNSYALKKVLSTDLSFKENNSPVFQLNRGPVVTSVKNNIINDFYNEIWKSNIPPTGIIPYPNTESVEYYHYWPSYLLYYMNSQKGLSMARENLLRFDFPCDLYPGRYLFVVNFNEVLQYYDRLGEVKSFKPSENLTEGDFHLSIIDKTGGPLYHKPFVKHAANIFTVWGYSRDYSEFNQLQEQVKINHFSPNKLEMEVSIDQDKLLYYADNWHKDWHCFMDDREIPILKANYTFKAVPVSAGKHNIKFEYRPSLFIMAFRLQTILLMFYSGFICVALFRIVRDKQRV